MQNDSGSGYGRPPRHSRFKPGQSGNPSGRPKGAVSFRADLADELAELIAIRDDSGEMRITKRRAIVKKVVSASIFGDPKHASALLSLCAKLFPEMDEADPHAAEDEAFVDKLAEREQQAADEVKTIAPPSMDEPEDE